MPGESTPVPADEPQIHKCDHGMPSSEVLEKAFTQALRDFFPIRDKNFDPRADFYALYKRESGEYDREFIKKYDDDLNTILIFAGLFSAVTSTFIVDAQQNLQEDFTQTSAKVLLAILQKLENPSSGSSLIPPGWTAPPYGMVQILSVFYSSLGASLLAAFMAMLGKQWINRYERVGTRGSVIDRSRDRQVKTDGMKQWHFNLVMESLTSMLQIAVLLLGYALSQYLWTIDHTVASVIFSVSLFGVMFYSFIVVAGVMSYNCPFQTPASHTIRSAAKKTRRIFQSGLSRLRYIFRSRLGPIIESFLTRLHLSVKLHRTIADVESSAIATPRRMPNKTKAESLFKTQNLNQERVLDIGCASWLLDNSTDADVMLAVVRFVPDVEIHAAKTTPSLARLLDPLSACFYSPYDSLTGQTEKKLYEAAKVFLQTYTHKKCFNKDDVVFQQLPLYAETIPLFPTGKAELHSVLEMVRQVVRGEGDKWTCPESSPKALPEHLTWISYHLVFRVREFLQNGTKIPDGVYDFFPMALSSPVLTSEEFLGQVLSDFLLAIGLTVGLHVPPEDLLVANKSQVLDTIINRLYKQLNKAFRNVDSQEEMNHLLAALGMMNNTQVASRLTVWSDKVLADEMATSTATVHPQEKLFSTIMELRTNTLDKWPAARLALQLPHRNKTLFKDSKYLITFLEHHFLLERDGHDQTGPIADALETLVSSESDHPQPYRLSFESMRTSLKSERPIRLRCNALLVIHRSHCDFDGPELVLEEHQREEFCADMAAVGLDLIDDPRYKSAYPKIFLRMVNSQVWQPQLEHLLTCFGSSRDLLTSQTRQNAYDLAKGFLQLYTQKKSTDAKDVGLEKFSSQAEALPMWSPEDADLSSMLEMTRQVVKGDGDGWGCSKVPPGVSVKHLTWMSHHLVCRVWEFGQAGVLIPDQINEFLHDALSSPPFLECDSISREPIVFNFLLTVGLTVGLCLDPNESQNLDAVISRLYEQLNKAFHGARSHNETHCLLGALEIMNVANMLSRLASWSSDRANEGAAGSVHSQERLFCTIMELRTRNAEEWPAAHLALQLALRNESFSQHFRSSEHLITFLEHHFLLERDGHDQTGPIADAFEAMSSPFLHPPQASSPSQRSMLQSVRSLVKSDRHIRLRRNSLFFIVWAGCRDFDALELATESRQRSEFCMDLAFLGADLTGHRLYGTCHIEILLLMANSQIWRPDMRLEDWERLEILCKRDSNLQSESLDGCLRNQELIPSLLKLDDGKKITESWLKVVWRQPFETISPRPMIDQIRAATMEVLHRGGKPTMEEFRGLINPGPRELMFQKLCDDVRRTLEG